ncbi:MAG TPA: hypothetical protein VIX14_15050 [Terriglobales bacterium]
MTAAEAPQAGHGRESFGCVILKNVVNTAIAIFYFDSPNQDAFGDNEKWKECENAVLRGCEKTGLTAVLDKIRDELATHSRLIKIHQ